MKWTTKTRPPTPRLASAFPSPRRAFLGAVPLLTAARLVLAASGAMRGRLGLCTFSCHQHWQAVGAGQPGVRFVVLNQEDEERPACGPVRLD